MKHFVYIGKWDHNPGPDSNIGFGIYEYDPETAELTHVKDLFKDLSAGFTFLDDKRNVLYCTNEVETLPGLDAGGGRVFAYSLDPETGDMTEISCKPSFAPLPCGCCLDPTGKFLLVTNHSTSKGGVTKAVKDQGGKYHLVIERDDSTVVLYPVNDDGSLDDPCDIYKLTGHGGLKSQTRPHPHSVSLAPDGSCFLVCDKGADRIWSFKIDYEERKLVMLGSTGGSRTAPGSSPRYGCFLEGTPYFIVNNETTPYVCTYKYDGLGNVELVHSLSVVPDGYDIDNPPPELSHPKHRPEQSDLKLHPSGKWLYDIIRGLDLVEVFDVDSVTGALTRKQTVEIKPGVIPQLAMHGPRGMAVSPDGKYLLLASGATDEVIVWSIGDDGCLTPVRSVPVASEPANITFFG